MQSIEAQTGRQWRRDATDRTLRYGDCELRLASLAALLATPKPPGTEQTIPHASGTAVA